MLNWIWHADRWTQEPWTLWTAALMHLNSAHALANLLALLSLLALARAWRLGWATAAAALLAWPLSVASLVLWPSVSSYAGLSGPLHALAAVLVVHRTRTTWQRYRQLDASAGLLALGLLAKLGLEAAWRHPVAWDGMWGFNVVYVAHLGGAVCGLLCALSLRPQPWAQPIPPQDAPQ